MRNRGARAGKNWVIQGSRDQLSLTKTKENRCMAHFIIKSSRHGWTDAQLNELYSLLKAIALNH